MELFEAFQEGGRVLSEEQAHTLARLQGLPGSGRSRIVRLHADLQESESLKLNLFDDMQLVAVKKPLDLGGDHTFVWVGEILESGGVVLLLVHGDFLHGVVQTGSETFRVSPIGPGLCALRQVVPSESDPPGCGVREEEIEGGREGEREHDRFPESAAARDVTPAVARPPPWSTAKAVPLGKNFIPWPPGEGEVLSGEEVLTEVLVAYDSDAAQLVPDIVGHIEYLVAWTNLSYVLSRVQSATPGPCWPWVQCVIPRLHVVRTMALECPGCEYFVSNGTILTLFAKRDDGWYDEVHDVRDESQADICVLMSFLDRPYDSGVAMSGPPDPEAAFCVVETPYSLNHSAILAHEIGHLQGAQHETGTVLARPYAKAFCHYAPGGPEEQFGTIMCTYASHPIPYFSNPEVAYVPTGTDSFWLGDAGRNNARCINESALIVASHRGENVVPVSVTDFVGRSEDGQVQLDWRLSDAFRDELAGVHVQRSEQSDGAYRERTPVPLPAAGVMSWVDAEVTPGRTYWYRLRLVGVEGGSQFAGPLHVTVGEGSRYLQIQEAEKDQVRIRYGVGPESAAVLLGLYDVRGRLVDVLEQAKRSPGEHSVNWSRQTRSGVRVGRGVYWFRLQVAGEVLSARLVLLQD